MLGFSNGDEFATLRRFGDLPFPNGLGVWLEDADYLVRHVGVAAEQARPRLRQNALDERAHLLHLLSRASQDGRGRVGRRPELLSAPPHHGHGVTNRPRRRHQAAVSLDHGIAGLRRPRLQTDRQAQPCNTPCAIAHAAGRRADGPACAVHRSREYAHAILQQGAVGRVMHIGFYDRRVDAKPAAVRHPHPRGHVDDPLMQIGDHVGPQGLGALPNGLGIGHGVSTPTRAKARYTRLARTSCSNSSKLQSGRCFKINIRRTTSAGVPSRPRLRLCGHRCSSADATVSITASSSSNVSIRFNHSAHRFVAVRQQHLEQTAFLLASSNHVRSFRKRSWLRSVVRLIRSRQPETGHLDTQTGLGSVRNSHFGGEFFTGRWLARAVVELVLRADCRPAGESPPATHGNSSKPRWAPGSGEGSWRRLRPSAAAGYHVPDVTELRRLLFPAMTVAGLIAFVMSTPRYPELTGWGVLFVLATSLGALMWMRTRRISRWFVASVPWWMMANSSGWFEFGAVMLTLGGLIAVATGPTLPGRRRGRPVAPLAHLAGGPVTPIEARAYPAARPSRIIQIATVVMFCLSCALAIAGASGSEPATTGALALAGLIITATFAFSNWFSGRVRVRIDDRGLHSRAFFAEQTIRWTDIAGLTLRYVFFPGMGVRIVYYVVFSPSHEFNFPSSMTGAKELQTAIEAATGLSFPEPEITPNL